MRISRLQVLWAFLSLLTTTCGQNADIQTIFENPSYSKLRPCAQNCFYFHLGQPATYLRDLLGSRIGCSMVRTSSIRSLQVVAENDCFCRADLQEDAQAEITRCVMSRCDENENDAAAAGAMYSGYCAADGHAEDGGGQATPTGGTSSTTDDGEDASPGAGSGQSSPTDRGEGSSASSVRSGSATLLVCLVSMALASIVSM